MNCNLFQFCDQLLTFKPKFIYLIYNEVFNVFFSLIIRKLYWARIFIHSHWIRFTHFINIYIYIFIKFYFIKNIYLSWFINIIYPIIIKYFNSIWKLIKSAINKRYIILKNIIWIGFKSPRDTEIIFYLFFLLLKGMAEKPYTITSWAIE